MREQLTLGGLGDSALVDQPMAAKKQVKKVAVKAPSKNAQIDADIQARVQKLLDEQAERVLKTDDLVFIEEKKLEVIVEPVIEKAPQPQKPIELTVTELNKNIKKILEGSFPLIWVKGEISNLKIPSSGHIYFTLKDSGAQIRAVMFRGFAQSLKFRPEDGMEVLVRCKVTVYEPRGDYQLFCEVMEPVGFGALQIAFEKLKAQLTKEGLFDQARKRPLPSFPKRIAIITSPTGAVIRDMLNVLARRFGGGLDITLIPTAVQGDRAPKEISQAVNLVSTMGAARFDVLIVGRGGGSLEDLWAFNTEEVARAVSACSIPTISAVGHEVDFTICDFVADLRAPTPSAAAELVVKNKADLFDNLRSLNRQLNQKIITKIQVSKTAVFSTSKRLVDPKRRLQDLMLRCDEWTDRLTGAMGRFISDSQTEVKFLSERLNRISNLLQRFQTQFSRLAGTLNSLSPLAVLDRGYSIVKKQGGIIKSAMEVKKGEKIEIKMSEGEIKAEVL